MKKAVKVLNIIGLIFNILTIVGLVMMLVFKQDLIAKMQETYNDIYNGISFKDITKYFDIIVISGITIMSFSVLTMILQLVFIENQWSHILALIFGILAGSLLEILASIFGIIYTSKEKNE